MRNYSRHFRIGLILLLLACIGMGTGCSVYFNTFFNAKKSFNRAEKARKNSKTGTAGQGDYRAAMVKALKVVENYPNSKYYDDALYVLGVSYYHTEQYGNAERRFRELLANYGDSEYARSAHLYLAKSKLALGDIDDAMVFFEQVFQEEYDREFKAEAAMVLGQYHIEEKNYEQSLQFLQAVRDSLGDDIQKRQAQILIADGSFADFKFRDALSGYLQVLGTDPDKDDKYHALYRAALSSFRLQRVDVGFEYLDQLIKDELYFDSLGRLQLTVAQGYELDDDLLQAEAMYEEVAATTIQRNLGAVANYRLGLIYQFDYDNLQQAKEYYDEAAAANRSSEIGRDALQRSSDIGKLETFARNPLDSNATLDAIDEAAFTQYLLSELYWFRLDKPDTAILEMQYVVDSFPSAYHAPKALIALSEMYREHIQDEHAADSILKLVITRYPNSDYVAEAVGPLGLSGTANDTGYAEIFIHRAEDHLIGEENIDSARINYQHVVDNYPDSKYHLAAQFALLWLTEMYDAPGDSSLILAYQEFADSFPGTMWADTALRRIGAQSTRPSIQRDVPEAEAEDDSLADTLFADVGDTESPFYQDPLIALYFRPDGDSLVDIRTEPIEILDPFEFPAEAAATQQYEWQLYFQILVDFSGQVIDYVLQIPSGVTEIDERAEITVASMTFDGMDISNRIVDAGLEAKSGGNWFVYPFRVIKPEHLR
ncbi:MAG: hypothetical protein DRP45_07330 [Candidatus Zixiibacteriota bacterium]|nr:MAG: hypothetical protein DRP45_07330 [candidate division Zixibacteria bacterium]